MENMTVRNIDSEKKRKCLFVLRAQGKTLSDIVREEIDKYAKEFDEKYSKEV